MSELTPQSSRGDVLESMMRRPETRKLITEALASPIGSTSRAKAQKLFKIVNKVTGSYDGSGGPGMMYDQMDYGYNTVSPEMGSFNAPADNPKSMVIFHKIPTPKITYGNKAKPTTVPDGTGGPGIYDGKGGFFGDIGASVSNALSSFTTPFTDILSVPTASASSMPPSLAPNMSTNSGPVYAPPPTTPAPNMSTNSGPVYVAPAPLTAEQTAAQKRAALISSATANGQIITDPTTGKLSVAPAAPFYQATGPIPQLADWVGGTLNPAIGNALKTTAKGVLSLGGAIPALAQTVGQDVAAIPGALYRNLWSGQPINPAGNSILNLPFISPGDTWAGKQIAGLWSNPSTTSPSTKFPSLSNPVSVNNTPPADNALKSTNAANNTVDATLPGGAPSNVVLGSNLTTGASTTDPGDYTAGAHTYNFGSQIPGSSGSSSGTSTPGSAALNYGNSLGIVDLNSPLSGIISSKGTDAMVAAIIKNEGASPAGVSNNPGNIKFYGGADQVDSGIKAADGGTFASYSTPEAGRAAIAAIVNRAASGNSSIYGANPTLASFANKYTNTGGSTSGPGQYSGLAAAAKAAVDSGTQTAGTFAASQIMDPNNADTKGLTEAEAEAENRKVVLDKYKLDEKYAEIQKLKSDLKNLPQDEVDYITARDTYIKKTDKAIDDYTNITMKSMDMSDPVKAQEAQSHLNMLYVLRGRQNKTYMGYLNDAVNTQQQKLDFNVEQYNKALTDAENDLNSKNAITQDKYKTYMAMYSDVFTAIQDAPTREFNLQILKNSATAAAGTGAVDAYALDQKIGLTKQMPELKNVLLTPDGKYALQLKGTDLQNRIKNLMVLNPSIQPNNMIEGYTLGVENFLNANTDKDEYTGDGITNKKKLAMAESAIENFSNLAADDPNAILISVQNSVGIAGKLSEKVKDELIASSPTFLQATKDLARYSAIFHNPKTPPTETEFIKSATGGSGGALETLVAKSIYSQFTQYVQLDGNKPTSAGDFVKAYTSIGTGSSSGRTDIQEATPEQFASRIADSYTQALLWSYFRSNTAAATVLDGILNPKTT